ncbi:uncharacterized protein EI90DRAFT_2926441 [Cantharellus anzutake]|uniref:uncharacterized protein n=1 Tax=Cantharellus anzutake TaxID=1750568 RepID=UPI00190591CC|nr:uncharacterized protein EI90DRAFT_2926441 [Cantharellus anzutake]KAF8328198.1 hypothetical protein EI90DRAFT_2926441 [Cantharellus anzutake]
MDPKELETYQVQLSQVELALVSEPDSQDLISLRTELQELISLTEQSIALAEKNKANTSVKASSSKVASTVSPTFQSGDDVLAKYSGDNQWYPARITSVGGSEEKRVYSVAFKGYNSTELVQASSIKPLPPNYAQTSALGKRKAEDEAERERRKKRNEKKAEARAVKAKEQSDKAASWMKFAKKAEKKGAHIAGLSGTSIFKTPDNPHGRVGVTGSGKGMTEYQKIGKHKYADDSNP